MSKKKNQDDLIDQLLAKVAEKKAEIEDAKKPFTPVTNSLFPKDIQETTKINLRVLTKDQLQMLYVYNIKPLLEVDAQKVLSQEPLKLGGFTAEQWLHDVKALISRLELSSKEKELQVLEKALKDKLSEGRKTECFLDEAAKLLA